MYQKRRPYNRLILASLIAISCYALPGNAGAQEVSRVLQKGETHIYEKLTYPKLSQLYWKLSKFDSTDDKNIDNFMRINECEIYQDYFYDEFEWKTVRESSRKYILSNIKEFPTRFEVEQPIRLSEYDMEQEIFNVWEPYQIENKKLFEVLSEEYDENVCGISWGTEVPGYPKGLIMEIPRPISITKIKMSPDVARSYINMKKKNINKERVRNKDNIYEARTAYVVMKVKFVGLRGKDEYEPQGRRMRARALATLESYEIYADQRRKFLIYSKDFGQREETSIAEEIFRERLKKRKAIREKEAAAQTGPEQNNQEQTP